MVVWLSHCGSLYSMLLTTLIFVSENGTPALPDQVFGFYFGWAKVDVQKSFKVMVSIGWDHCSCISKRKFVSNQPLTGQLPFFFMSLYAESYENSMIYLRHYLK
jgi:hypothetical protein